MCAGAGLPQNRPGLGRPNPFQRPIGGMQSGMQMRAPMQMNPMQTASAPMQTASAGGMQMGPQMPGKSLGPLPGIVLAEDSNRLQGLPGITSPGAPTPPPYVPPYGGQTQQPPPYVPPAPPPYTPFTPDPGPQPTGPGFSDMTYQQYMDHFFNNPSHDTQVMNGMLGMHPVSEDQFNAIRGQQANFGPGR